MTYRIEVFNAANQRMAVYHDSPLLETWRRGPDQRDTVRGLLPELLPGFGPGCEVAVWLGERLAARATVTRIAPEWSDTRKLILEDYVPFSEVMAFEAEGPMAPGNTVVSRVYEAMDIASMVRDVINAAPGALHYTVEHGGYPDGAEREHAKFLARKTEDNALETGGIGAGQWVGADRIDATGAYAKDGDTIAGLVVDGVAWPDLRLMLVDCEETTRNSHAVKRHPEVAAWSDARYARSGYKLRADAAKTALQSLIDTHGIDFIELNPHRDALGVFDDRVDAFGRYIGLAHGGGLCFNAALVELGHADVYLYEDGAFHPPAMALKEFFSYRGETRDSIAETEGTLHWFDARGGALEIIAALAYAAGGHVFSVDHDLAVGFRKPALPDRVIFFDPHRMGVSAGADATELGNVLVFRGNPQQGNADGVHARGDSIEAYGTRMRLLEHFGITESSDAERLVNGLLDDLAYPNRAMSLTLFHGDIPAQVGEIIELRGAPPRRVDEAVGGEWGGAFEGGIVGRVSAVRHRFHGRHVTTTLALMSPLRSVASPLSFLVRSQEPAATHFQFRLDERTVGLDQPFRLD